MDVVALRLLKKLPPEGSFVFFQRNIPVTALLGMSTADRKKIHCMYNICSFYAKLLNLVSNVLLAHVIQLGALPVYIYRPIVCLN